MSVVNNSELEVLIDEGDESFSSVQARFFPRGIYYVVALKMDVFVNRKYLVFLDTGYIDV